MLGLDLVMPCDQSTWETPSPNSKYQPGFNRNTHAAMWVRNCMNLLQRTCGCGCGQQLLNHMRQSSNHGPRGLHGDHTGGLKQQD